MAFTSFTLRNTVSDGGSSLRSINDDTGLRADGYFIPVPESFLESTFEANVYKRTEIELQWSFGFTLVSPGSIEPSDPPTPVEVLIRASSYGEPITAGDGDFVKRITSSDFSSSHVDKNTAYIKEGSWVYYGMFVKYQDSAGDGFYERVAVISVQIPRDFGSTQDLWSRIPLYYRNLDQDYALKTEDYLYTDGPLYRYVELFGWELDKIRTTIYDTMRINDPEVIHSSAIDALADQSGLEFGKDALGTAKVRAVLNNIGYLRRTKGTVNSVEAYISALSGCGVTTEKVLGVHYFKVHPMRANLVTDPFFQQSQTGPVGPDSGTVQREWAAYAEGGREHGWGVHATFSSAPVGLMSVSTAGDKLTVTLPALSGTASVLVYSRGVFGYNNNLRYYFSGISSHNYTPRFFPEYGGVGLPYLSNYLEASTPGAVEYLDSWNNSVTTFPTFKDFLTNDTRKIVSSIPNSSSVPVVGAYPVFKFDITLSPSSETVLTLEKPMVEYRNSSGEFFSGDEAMGGFIPDPTGSVGEGLYDYHWGPNATSSPHTNFSYYTLDYHRVQSVVDNIIENYIVPVTVVKNDDYFINWDILE